MTHPQNSPRGLFSIKQLEVGAQTIKAPASTYLQFSAGAAFSGQTDIITQAATYLKLPTGLTLSAQTDVMTQTASGLKLPTGLALSGQAVFLTANSTARVIFPSPVTALPTTRTKGGLCFVSSAGKQAFAYCSTGGTWKYLAATSVLA